MNQHNEELMRLAGQQVERALTKEEQARLNELLRSGEEFVNLYTDYLCLHGQLAWDAGMSVGIGESPTPAPHSVPDAKGSRGLRSLLAVSTTLAVILGVWVAVSNLESDPQQTVDQPNENTFEVVDVTPYPGSVEIIDAPPVDDLKPIELAHQSNVESPVDTPSEEHTPAVAALPENFGDAYVVERIDELIRSAWAEQDVTPSDLADDSEWIRRVHLTMVGRIPTLEESRAFLSSKNPRKRNAVIDSLLESSERSESLAAIWTNLLIGRTERRGVNRDALYDYLASEFAENNAWIDTVGDLITATGRNDENGATNFLLAHLNNQATPATAVTAKLFMGEQISCVQCHDHPFSKEVKQEDYWALNAFFKDTVRVTVQQPQGKRKSKYLTCRLVDRTSVERITHYETRSGQQRAVLPRYDNYVVAENSDENRRERLAGLLASDSNTKIARAMVNRMWAHFFGFGFTNPIDDMGPHAAISHPELLDFLTEAFARSDYDVRRLMKWIAASEAWQLSSETSVADDVPEHGTTPMFSRVYTRRMTPEQVYESVRVAIRSSADQSLSHNAASLEHRREWVQQFARAYETDENDESLNFEGTIAQALVMMNGYEVDSAIRQATSTITSNAKPRTSELSLLERVALAMLTRDPTSSEKQAFRVHLSKLGQQKQAKAALSEAMEDMMWAYLNSSEFVLVH